MNYINSKRLFVAIIVLSLGFSAVSVQGKTLKNHITSAVFRLHVVANSNSAADQKLKLEVRNRIISETAELFSKAKNAEDAEKIANANLDFLKGICEDEISRRGFSQKVHPETGEYKFPQKTYGAITLPRGRYRALKVIIGEGKGKNWWCVMFPPLCFAKGTLSVSKSSKSYLESKLSSDEYNLICSNQNFSAPEIRFKTAEVIKKLKNIIAQETARH